MQLYEIKGQMHPNLIGMKIGGHLITENTPKHDWIHKEPFNCVQLNLVSLKGAPKRVSADFDCAENQLTSLEGAPERVDGYFLCEKNKLTTLEGAPARVGSFFNCDHNLLKSLKGVPRKMWITNGPDATDNYFSCSHNQLASLEGAPDVTGHFFCEHNQLTSLESIHRVITAINGIIYLSGNPLKSHVLGLLYINGLRGIKFTDNLVLHRIINKYLPNQKFQNKFGHKKVLDCQSELLDAGLDDFAQL